MQRSVEARALLVALSAAIDLRSATASEFAVKLLCRAIRTCLINALGSLRQTMSTEDRAALDRAEADLQVRSKHSPSTPPIPAAGQVFARQLYQVQLYQV